MINEPSTLIAIVMCIAVTSFVISIGVNRASKHPMNIKQNTLNAIASIMVSFISIVTGIVFMHFIWPD